MRYARLVAVVLALAGTVTGRQTGSDERATAKTQSSRNAAAFDQLKSLVGEWQASTVESGKPVEAPITFRLASGGSALMSDLAPGSPHEMVTMFHRDGEELLATHYCLTGNQPRMRALPSSDPNVVAFEFKDATNLPNSAAPHMAGVKFTLVDANHHIEDWTIVVNGQSSVRRFECHRKS
ncbi:MAG TPA: hypothetical protein VLC94_08190 [Candidatus Acidoferrum sp.]|nr:hypothetical protein [Candidatus Acidoferrum sp.]